MLAKLAQADKRLTLEDLMAEFADVPKPAAITAQPRKRNQTAKAA